MLDDVFTTNIKKYPILYKRTSTGAIQQWQQEINPQNPKEYRTISGQKGGKLVLSGWTLCQPTNEGKKNHRTAEMQVEFEIDANYKKRLEKDYHKSIDSIDIDIIFEPMLAKEYSKYKDKLQYKNVSYYCQPKSDGARCVAKSQGLFTRNGKEYKSVPHISLALQDLFEQFPSIIFDGELYNHTLKDDFNKVMSLIKKIDPTEKELDESEELIQYHIYDLYDSNNPNMKFHDRNELLKRILALSNEHCLQLVKTYPVNSNDVCDLYYDEFLESGYEGLMLRENSKYENKRTSSLLKRKETIDAEFELVDIQEGLGNWKGYAKRAILKLPDGRTFGAGVAGTQENCKEWLNNKEKYIGKATTVLFFAYTPDGVPRFGRVKEFNRGDL